MTDRAKQSLTGAPSGAPSGTLGVVEAKSHSHYAALCMQPGALSGYWLPGNPTINGKGAKGEVRFASIQQAARAEAACRMAELDGAR